MTADEIKAAVRAGKRVHWSNEGYRVTLDRLGQFHIIHCRGMCIGLTTRAGKLNGAESEFYIAEETTA